MPPPQPQAQGVEGAVPRSGELGELRFQIHGLFPWHLAGPHRGEGAAGPQPGGSEPQNVPCPGGTVETPKASRGHLDVTGAALRLEGAPKSSYKDTEHFA